MPASLNDIYTALEDIADYNGPWLPLRDERERLAQRIAELRERETRLDDLLVVALVGGSGVGKSTLLNAIAGDELARTSEMRPCTTHPTIYHPPGAHIAFPSEWASVAGSALENLVLIDTPDSDTIVEEHRARVIDVLRECDLVMICGDSEKYLDEATWALLRPLQGERTMVCVETKAARAESVREHWLSRLAEQGFEIEHYFRVDSRRTFDRKVNGTAPENEFDFAALENFLAEELSRDRIARIKRSNTAGLLRKTLETLETRVVNHKESLAALEERLADGASDIHHEAEALIARRLFAQPHLWTYALGREISVRSKGVVGTLYRGLEAARTLPARISTWSPFRGAGMGHGAAALLTDHDLVGSSFNVETPALEDVYRNTESKAHLELSRNGFEAFIDAGGYTAFANGLGKQVSGLLSGSAREHIGKQADRMTSWPVTFLLDTPPLAFFGFSAYHVVTSYFSSVLLPGSYFVQAGSVLGIILFVELFAYSTVARMMAWRSRRAARSELHARLAGASLALIPERHAVQEARERIAQIERLDTALEPGP